MSSDADRAAVVARRARRRGGAARVPPGVVGRGWVVAGLRGRVGATGRCATGRDRRVGSGRRAALTVGVRRRSSGGSERRGRRCAGVLLGVQVSSCRPVAPAALPARGSRASRTSPRTAPRSSPATTCRSPTRSSCRSCCKRRITFLAKTDYFTRPGLQGLAHQAFFMRASARCRSTAPAGAPPRPRCAPGSGSSAEGELLGIYPEGTRSPTAGSTAARPAWRGWRSRPGCR